MLIYWHTELASIQANVCVHVQSKPMSYAEIREENSSDIKASVATSVVRKQMHMPHLLF